MTTSSPRQPSTGSCVCVWPHIWPSAFQMHSLQFEQVHWVAATATQSMKVVFNVTPPCCPVQHPYTPFSSPFSLLFHTWSCELSRQSVRRAVCEEIGREAGVLICIAEKWKTGKGAGSVFLSVCERGTERHTVWKAWSTAIFNLLWQPDRASLYIVWQRQLG